MFMQGACCYSKSKLFGKDLSEYGVHVVISTIFHLMLDAGQGLEGAIHISQVIHFTDYFAGLECFWVMNYSLISISISINSHL